LYVCTEQWREVALLAGLLRSFKLLDARYRQLPVLESSLAKLVLSSSGL
jgi:hypothetical protein